MTKLLAPADLPTKGISYSASQRDRLEKAGRFPKRVRLSAHRYAYLENEVDAWLQERIAARDNLAKTG